LTTAPSSGATKGAISAQSDTGGSWSTFWSRVREGFHHIIPEGLDHILFVLGLFMLARTWRPILAQVTTFTLAHSITLALATLGYISVRAEIVEPIIAASIAIIALENLFRPTYGKFRLAMVFLFGLIHGLGFAQRLVDDRIPADSLLGSLLGFNVGVELGQLAVIALAVAATAWIKDEERYRRWVVIPGSTAIALAGVYWAVSRTF
jgi:hydrogenase/urease accessory protein HupE